MANSLAVVTAEADKVYAELTELREQSAAIMDKLQSLYKRYEALREKQHSMFAAENADNPKKILKVFLEDHGNGSTFAYNWVNTWLANKFATEAPEHENACTLGLEHYTDETDESDTYKVYPVLKLILTKDAPVENLHKTVQDVRKIFGKRCHPFMVVTFLTHKHRGNQTISWNTEDKVYECSSDTYSRYAPPAFKGSLKACLAYAAKHWAYRTADGYYLPDDDDEDY